MIRSAQRVSYFTLFSRGGLTMSTNGIRTAATDGKKVAIFDKDGTLLCMNAMLAPWMVKVAERMEAATGLAIKDEIYKDMGFDPCTRKFGSGHVLESTNEVCIRSLTSLLEKKGFSSEKARDVSVHCYDKDGSPALMGELLPFGDVHSIFSRLRGKGYLIAVNTSDSRIMTENTLGRLGVSDLVDMVVCGSDEDVKPKPDAYTALKICSRLGVHPKNSVFIGDTITDAMCGKNAECGLVISVLTGGIDKSILEKKADVVVDSIEDAADFILNQD
nr:putative pyrophosphatase PpaX isoform X2 [Lytechinus pictus]